VTRGTAKNELPVTERGKPRFRKPLTGSDTAKPLYVGSTPDVVDFTYGLNIGIAHRAVLSMAYVNSVTGPTPFTGELVMLLNVPFGGRSGRNIPLTTPVLGR